MDKEAQNFIRRFHNLQGETVKERHQNFFRLLHEHVHLKNNPEELQFITANLHVTNFLEKILHVDFLIYFRQFNELYENFIKGDEITVKKLSKQVWFFHKAFKDVSSEKFVNSIMPTLSHSMKLKILRRLPLDEQQSDEFFDAVCNRYGIFLATNLLPKCTSQKIQKVLTTYPVKLSVAQLKRIIDKHSDLIYVYLEERIKHEGSNDFLQRHPILVYIAQKNPEVFCNLFSEYYFLMTLGRRTTKKVIRSQKDKISKDLENYFCVFNKQAAIRKMGNEIKDIYFKKEWVFKSSLCWNDFLKHYPKQQRFSLYRSAYDSFFYEKFGENIDVSDDILRLVSDREEREILARRKIEKDGNYHFLKYVKPDYCFKIVMEKINHPDYRQRSKYIEIATQCCIFHKDVTSLLKVLDLVCGRFKSDNGQIRSTLLTALGCDERILDNFSKKHWQYVIELIATAKAKKEWFWCEHVLISKYIHFSANNSISIREIVQKPYNWEEILKEFKFRKNSELFKLVVDELIEVGPTETDPCDEIEQTRFYAKLAYICKIYNEENPNGTIDVLKKPKMMKSAKELFQDQSQKSPGFECISGIEYIVCQKGSSEELQELKKMYFASFQTYGTMYGLMWFLKHEPKTLRDNFDMVLSNFSRLSWMQNKSLWRFVKKHHHLNLDQRALAFFRQRMSEECEHKGGFVMPLTILEDPAFHLDFIKTYSSASEKVDLTDNDTKNLYLFQKNLVKFLHYLNSPAEVLSAALLFCKGDYLQSALSPLYSCSYKLPESETKPFIEQISESKAVSVRKHAMHLSCVLYDAKTIHYCLKNATVPSLMATIKYFVKNPSTDLWDMIEKQIAFMKKEQVPLLKIAVNIKVPFEYKGKYIQIIWKIAEKFDDGRLKRILLTKFNKGIVENLESDFAFYIIRSSLFKAQEADTAVANILLFSKNDEKYTIFSEILTSYKKNFLENPDIKIQERHKLNLFVLKLYNVYMAVEETDLKFISELTTIFETTFPLFEVLQEMILIRCMVLKKETPENGAKILVDLNNVFYKKLGLSSVHTFAQSLILHVYHRVFVELKSKIKFCFSFLKLIKSSVCDYLLLIKLLPTNEPQDKENYVVYRDIVTQLSQVSDNRVHLELNLYLKSM